MINWYDLMWKHEYSLGCLRLNNQPNLKFSITENIIEHVWTLRMDLDVDSLQVKANYKADKVEKENYEKKIIEIRRENFTNSKQLKNYIRIGSACKDWNGQFITNKKSYYKIWGFFLPIAEWEYTEELKINIMPEHNIPSKLIKLALSPRRKSSDNDLWCHIRERWID